MRNRAYGRSAFVIERLEGRQMLSSAHPATILTPPPSVLLDVPNYNWYYGCAPTAVGMMLGYWDKSGFSNIMPGDNGDATTQNVLNTIASHEDIVSGQQNRPVAWGETRYSGGGDWHSSKSYPNHANQPNSLADYLHTVDAVTSTKDVSKGLWSYLHATGNHGWLVSTQKYAGDGTKLWNNIVRQLSLGRPVVATVDHLGTKSIDHCATIVGYNLATHQLAWNTTVNSTPQWHAFGPRGTVYGIYSVVYLTPPSGK